MANLAYREVHAMNPVEARRRLIKTYQETGASARLRGNGIPLGCRFVCGCVASKPRARPVFRTCPGRKTPSAQESTG